MIDLIELEKKTQEGLAKPLSINAKMKELENTRGNYYVTKRGKIKYDISQTELAGDVFNYVYNSLHRLGRTIEVGEIKKNFYDIENTVSDEKMEELRESIAPLQDEIKYYKSQVKKYRDEIDREISNDPSGTQRFITSMGVHWARQVLDPVQWVPLKVAGTVGTVVGKKAGTAIGKYAAGKISEKAAQRVGAFIGRATNEALEEAIDQYTVDGELNPAGILTAGAAGGSIGEIPYLAKFLFGKSKLINVPDVKPKTDTPVKEIPEIKQRVETDYTKRSAEAKTTEKVDMDNMAELAEKTELHGAMKGKEISAAEVFRKSVRIEGATMEQAADEYLPKIARYFIDNKVIKGVVDEETFFKAVNENGKAVKEAFRKLGRRKDLPEDLKVAVKWYNDIMDETRIKALELDSSAIDNTIGALEKPNEYKIRLVPQEDLGRQAVPVKTEMQARYEPLAQYAVDNKLIKGVETVEDFFKEFDLQSRNMKKFLRNVGRKKDLPDNARAVLVEYNEIHTMTKIKEKSEAGTLKTIENDTRDRSTLDSETRYHAGIDPEKSTGVTNTPPDTNTNRPVNELKNPTPPPKDEVQIEKEYPFTFKEINEAEYISRKADRIKHNPRDYTKKQLERELRKDLNIPKKAKVTLINGNVPKTRVPIITGKDYDGNAVTGRSKWIRHTPEAEIEWENNGIKYYAKVEIVDGKWRGDIYSYNPKKSIVLSPEVEAKAPENIKPKPENYVDEIQGRYEPTEEQVKAFADYKKRLSKFLGLDKLNLNATSGEKAELQRKIAKVFGNFVKNKHNFKNIDEMIDYYKSKKGIDFELQIAPKKLGMLGETKLYATDKGNKVVITLTQEAMQDMDLAMGILRHEIEHATDFIKNPDFDGRPYHWLTPEKDMTVADYFNASTGGHFSTDNGSMYELNYIAANLMNDMVHDGKLNKEVVKRLGFDMIPDNPTAKDLELVSQAVEKSKAEQDSVKRLASLKRELENTFKIKKGLWEAIKKGTPSEKSAAAKEFLKTNILLPFEKIKDRMQVHILRAFEIEYDGHKYNIETIPLLFEANKTNFTDWCFYWGVELPAELEPIRPQLENLRTTLNSVVDKLREGTDLSKMDIINALNYDSNLTVLKLIPEGERKKYMKRGGEIFDADKFDGGDTVFDEDVGETVTERLLNVSEKFVNEKWQFFSSADKTLEHLLKRGDTKPEKIIRVLKEARDCMTRDNFVNLLRKYNVENIPEIRDYLLKHQELVKEENTLFGKTVDETIQANIEASKRKNAKRAFLRDYESVKGEDNRAIGTHLHRFGRFVEWEADGLIERGKMSEFARATSVDPAYFMIKFVEDISTAYAIRDTMPFGQAHGVERILNELAEQKIDKSKKTYLKDIENYIEMELGHKLGVLTDPPETLLDRVVKTFLEWTSRVNLMGPKFLRELLQEPGGMTESKILLWGGSGTIGTYKDMIKAQRILMLGGDELRRINSVLGDRWDRSVSLEAFNIMLDDLGDFTGYYAKQRAKYGTAGDKLAYKLRTGMEKLNWYSYTQRVMKLAANFGAGHIMENLASFKNLDEVFSNNTKWVKRTFKDIGINETDFILMKDLMKTETFQKYGIFDEVQFSDMITKDRYSELLGRELTADEFKLLREDTAKKISKLNDRIVSDISPTETTGATKAQINQIKDPVLRNFVRLTGHFKTSIAEGWRRKVRNYRMANIDPDTGTFDYSDVVYQKRLLRTLMNRGAFLATVAVITDVETYEDPIEAISERVDELFDNPASVLWAAVQEELNLWGLTTGANALRQPFAFVSNASKGKYDKAAKSLIKMGVGTTNYNMGEKAYNFLFDD